MCDDELVRNLDSYLRFYQSESLAHIGYELTLTGLVAVGLTNPVFGLIRQFLDWVLVRALTMYHLPFFGFASPEVADFCAAALSAFICFGLFASYFFGKGWPSPFNFKYLFARGQYYMCLFEIIHEHMGGIRPTIEQHVVQDLRSRAERMGVAMAVQRLFEAHLATSIQRRLGRTELGPNELSHFDAEQLYQWYPLKKEVHWYDERLSLNLFRLWRWKVRWKLLDLLALAYRETAEKYGRSTDPQDLVIGRLLEPGIMKLLDC